MVLDATAKAEAEKEGAAVKRAEPSPRGFVENEWYEQVDLIRRTQPRRFFLFSPQTKRALSVYLDLKERHQQERQRAA